MVWKNLILDSFSYIIWTERQQMKSGDTLRFEEAAEFEAFAFLCSKRSWRVGWDEVETFDVGWGEESTGPLIGSQNSVWKDYDD